MPRRWWVVGRLSTYRYVPAEATYDPGSPWAGSGRFDDGKRLTLYVADAPQTAVAEFLRRHPEFLDLQDALRIRVYEVIVITEDRVLDVRTPADAAAAGITHARLVSSESDEKTRYVECRALADTTQAECIGIAYPSAALDAEHWSLVLFGPRGDAWTSEPAREVPRPFVSPGDVAVISHV